VTVNDRELVQRLVPAIRRQLGESNVVEGPPVMGAEDFSEYGRAGARAAILWVGAVEPGRHAEAARTGTPLPSLHSALFAPDRGPAIRAGVTALTAAALELLGR
jgi:hippurate hydrolase